MASSILLYIFIAVFAITAVLTLAGITGIIKMEEGYLKPLYRLLLLEVVGFILAFMVQTYLNKDAIDHNKLAERAGLRQDAPNQIDALETWIEGHFEKSAKYEGLLDTAKTRGARLNRLLTDCDSAGDCPNGFHRDLDDLIRFLPQYYGTINLDFEARDKAEVYLVLADILNQLELISKEDAYSDRAFTKPNYKRIRQAYLGFREEHYAEIIDGEEYLILPSDIGNLLQEYANRLRK